jgi:hypothetical protein
MKRVNDEIKIDYLDSDDDYRMTGVFKADACNGLSWSKMQYERDKTHPRLERPVKQNVGETDENVK